MNDRSDPIELEKSPGFLLQELGIGMVGLYRHRLDEYWVLPAAMLDDEIWENGEAMVFRLLPDYRPAIIRLGEKGSVPPSHREGLEYTLLSVRPNYVGAGQKFWVALREEVTRDYDYWPISVMSLLELLPYAETDLILPC